MVKVSYRHQRLRESLGLLRLSWSVFILFGLSGLCGKSHSVKGVRQSLGVTLNSQGLRVNSLLCEREGSVMS